MSSMLYTMHSQPPHPPHIISLPIFFSVLNRHLYAGQPRSQVLSPTFERPWLGWSVSVWSVGVSQNLEHYKKNNDLSLFVLHDFLLSSVVCGGHPLHLFLSTIYLLVYHLKRYVFLLPITVKVRGWRKLTFHFRL